jgi:predicted MFS family arabinose efflux permease
MMLFVSGLTNTFPVFFPALLDEFGGTRAATASTVTLMWLVGAALGPLAGTLVGRFSPRRVVATGLAAGALGLGGAVLSPSLPLFVVSLGLGVGVSIGLTGMVTQAAVIADRYVRRRGVAMGIAFSGSMAAYVLSSPAHAAIAAWGWRVTLAGYLAVVLALLPLALATYPSRLETRSRPASTSPQDANERRLLRSFAFWALAFVSLCAPMVGYLATVQHALYFDALGFPADEAAAMLAIGGVLSTAGRVLVGVAADRFGPGGSGIASLAISLAGTLCLLGLEWWPGRVLAYAYVALVFLPLGTRGVVIPLLVHRIAAPAQFGTVFGWLVLINSAGAALGPLISGAIFDATRSYAPIYVVAAALIALSIAGLVHFLTATRARSGAPRREFR